MYSTAAIIFDQMLMRTRHTFLTSNRLSLSENGDSDAQPEV